MSDYAAGRLPVNRPRLPQFEQLAPYIRQIDAARYYSNFGPLLLSLQDRLAHHFGIEPACLCSANSGTSALIGAILAAAGRATASRPLRICPSYTFVATAVAAANCGYAPYFVDVDSQSWMADPTALRHLPALERAGLVVPVTAYGRQIDWAGWERFRRDTGIPVVIDAAAAFDTLPYGTIGAGQVPAAISLHATKTFSTAEGGLVVCGDHALVDRCATALNFGFNNSRESLGPSTNGKLSEYHAAVGHAELDGWPDKRGAFLQVARSYRSAAERAGLADRIVADTDRANAYALFVATSAAEAERATTALIGDGIEFRRWYGLGLHRQPAFAACPHDGLATTGNLAPRIIGLPFAVDMEESAVERVVSRLAAA